MVIGRGCILIIKSSKGLQKSRCLEIRGIISGPPKHHWIAESEGKPSSMKMEAYPRLHKQIAASSSSSTTQKVHQLHRKSILKEIRKPFSTSEDTYQHLFYYPQQTATEPTFTWYDGQHLLTKVFHLQLDSSSQISIWLCSILLRGGRGSLPFFKAEESNSGFSW